MMIHYKEIDLHEGYRLCSIMVTDYTYLAMVESPTTWGAFVIGQGTLAGKVITTFLAIGDTTRNTPPQAVRRDGPHVVH